MAFLAAIPALFAGAGATAGVAAGATAATAATAGVAATAATAGVAATAATGISLGDAALAATLVGTGVSAYSMVSQGDAANQAAQFNANIAAQNANASMAASANAASLASIQTQQKLSQASRFEGAQRAGFLRAGVTSSGSAQSVMDDSAIQGQLQASATEYAGLTDSYNFRLAASSLSGQSSLDQAQGSNAQTAGEVNAGASLLQGSGQAIGIAANPNFRNQTLASVFSGT